MGRSESLANNKYLDRAEFNRLQVNNLLVNNLTSDSTRPFANKTYKLNTGDVGGLTSNDYVQYVFNENGTEYNLEGVVLGVKYTFMTNIHVYQSSENTYKYFSHMIFTNDNSYVFSRYCQTGMEFNTDFTQINFSKQIGGSLFQYNLNNTLASLAHLAYPTDQQETVKNMIELQFLLEDTDTYGRILTLVN